MGDFARSIMDSIRRRDPELADAMDREECSDFTMSDDLRARLDAWLTGQGYLVNGRRVDPSSVVIVRAPDG